MSDALNALQLAVSSGFILLGVAIGLQYGRRPSRPHAYLAVAIAGLALVALVGQIQRLTPGFGRLLSDLKDVLFMASGIGLVLFRGVFFPLRRRTLGMIIAAAALISLITIAADVPYLPGQKSTPFQAAVVLALILVWSACIVEPTLRLALASRRLPSVQRARVQSLSIGFFGLMLIVVVSGGGGDSVRNPWVALAIQLMALLLIPFLYVSFQPPGWLRREWRVKEEAALHGAMQDLLLYSPDRRTLAGRAVEWARRLVGGDAAFIAAGDHSIWAVIGLSDQEAAEIATRLPDASGGAQVQLGLAAGRSAIVAGLPLDDGVGHLVILAGPFTPVFAAEELGLLQQYASAITVGLDRCRLTERLTALERTKTEFLNLASHELRGPITVIRGYLSMMESGTLGPWSAQMAAALPVLAAKADQMKMLVEQMIEAARLEEGQLELQPEEVDLREIAAQAVEMMRPLGQETHRLVLHTPDRQVEVVVDPGRISTIITNLLDNAIKYSPGGGEVRCDVDNGRGVASVRVSDQGVGIAEDDIPRLFTRFGRITTKETSHIGGTGLGLYLCRELARMHGGDITVESKPGDGTTFQLSVPQRTAGAAAG